MAPLFHCIQNGSINSFYTIFPNYLVMIIFWSRRCYRLKFKERSPSIPRYPISYYCYLQNSRLKRKEKPWSWLRNKVARFHIIIYLKIITRNRNSKNTRQGKRKLAFILCFVLFFIEFSDSLFPSYLYIIL